MRVVLLGAPGSGKGTQGQQLSTHFGIPRLSTGDALRDAVRLGTDLGKKAKTAMDAGLLVEDSVVVGIVKERLKQPDTANGFILDGFPRNTQQAQVLDQMLAVGTDTPIEKVVHLSVSDDEILERLLARSKKEGRADDTEQVIRGRMTVYNVETAPLLTYYGIQNKIARIDGMGEPAVVFNRILAGLEAQ